MGIEFNSNNLDAQKIYAALDAADRLVGDKTGDDRIGASIWNRFANSAGGNSIQNYIEKDNAIAAINRYLQKASAEIKNDIARFLNIQQAAEGKEGPEAVYAQIEEMKEQGPSKAMREKNKAREAIVEDYNTTKEELFGKNDRIFSVEPHSLATTKEQRVELLKTKGSNGYTYIQARAIVRDFKDLPSKLGEANKKEFGKYLDAYLKAKDDIKELEEKHPDIKVCYTDLKHEYDNVRFNS